MEWRNVLSFPKFTATIFLQLIYFALTEIETFVLALASILWGYILGWPYGLAIFFSVYLGMRMLGGYTSLLASKMQLVAQVIKERQ